MKQTVHDEWSGIGQENGITKADEFDRRRVLFACEQNALRTHVAMDDVIAVTVAHGLGHLTHVVTATHHIHTSRVIYNNVT